MIECKICHKTYKAISHTHLFFVHNYTQAEYIKDFKVRTIISPETKQILSKIHMGNISRFGQKWSPREYEFHSKNQKKLWKNPQYKKKFVRAIKSAWKTGTMREKRTEYLKEKWSDPTYRAEMSEMSRRKQGGLEYRRWRKRLMKKLWRTPSFQRKMAKRYSPGVDSPLIEEKWLEVVSWLGHSPVEFGFKDAHWNLERVRDLIFKKWGIHFHHASIGYQFRKRGCRCVPIDPNDSKDYLPSHHRFTTWIGPKNP
jgi:hypothetical protein